MRYLLDELMAYEEGFSDIMMGDRALDRHETFMAMQDPSAIVSKNDLLIFEANIMRQFSHLLTRIMTPTHNPGGMAGVNGMLSPHYMILCSK